MSARGSPNVLNGPDNRLRVFDFPEKRNDSSTYDRKIQTLEDIRDRSSRPLYRLFP